MKRLFFSIIALFALLGSSTAQVIEPVEWFVSAKGSKVVITAKIDSPWYMYDMGNYVNGPNGTTFNFTLPEGVTLDGGIKELTAPIKKYDEIFAMEIGHYSNEAVFEQSFINTSGETAVVKGIVEWQSCDGTSCLPPTDHEFSFKIAPTADVAATSSTEGSTVAPAESQETTEIYTENSDEATPAETVREEVVPTQPQEAGSDTLWAVLLTAAGGALLAIFTPCVFPMIPMTVSFFLQGSGATDEKSRRKKGRFMALAYGISIVALYTLPIAAIILVTYFVGGDSVTASIFNWLATHWIPNLIFFGIFVTFAISFFGAFEITMPSKLVNRSDSKADGGGLLGVFFMALTLVLVSFSCTGPIVGSVLVQSTQGGVWEPIITMLVFSTVFALPFTLLAFFPALLKNMPKSGGWLNSVKVVLGFIMLAFSLKFLSIADQTYHWGLLDREIYIALWIVIFSLLGLYLLGKLRLRHDSPVEYVSVKRLMLALASFAFVVYLIPGMWGAPLKGMGSFFPSLSTHDFNLMSVQSTGAQAKISALDYSKIEGGTILHSDFLTLPAEMEGFFDYNQARDYALKVNKPLLVEFTGHGCANCHNMEVNVLSEPSVRAIIQNDYVIVALYLDDKKELPENMWVTDSKGRTLKQLGRINSAFQIERFNVNSSPYYVLLDPKSEQILTQPRAFNLDVEAYIQFLKAGIEKYKTL